MLDDVDVHEDYRNSPKTMILLLYVDRRRARKRGLIVIQQFGLLERNQVCG